MRKVNGWVEPRGDRFVARWREDGRKRSLGFPSYELAMAHLSRLDRLRNAGASDLATMTVADLIETYIERGMMEQRWAPSTVAAYRRRTANYIEPAIGSARMQAVTTLSAQRWVDGMVRRKLSPSTIQATAAILSGAYAEAKRLGMVTDNPFDGVRLPTPKHRTPAFWTSEQVHRVLHSLDGDAYWYAVYLTAILTGMRPGEVRALGWDAVDLDRGVIVVKATMSINERNEPALMRQTKSGRDRMIAIPPSLVDALRLLPNDTVFVFERNGRPLNGSTWWHHHLSICERAGVPRITLHQIRHTSASLELLIGTPPRVVQERLGHSDSRITMKVYSHVVADTMRDASDRLDALVRKDLPTKLPTK